jgi:type VI secretion system protein ImpA
MPLRDDILNPIAGDNPGGENLRYAPVYDKIREARRQDDEGPMGDWQRERKVADWAQVIKLGSESIATKSKDLQLAVWLTEALLHKEGFPGFKSGLELIRALIENFWDSMYPELDEGDSEMRAAPLDWLGAHYLEVPIKRVPLTKSGLNFLDYHKAKKVGREADSQESYEKGEAFQAAVAAGELTLDDWDKAFNATSKEFYRTRISDIDAILQFLEDFQPLSEEKFGEFVPSLSKLRSILEEVRHQANSFLNTKLETDPDEPVDSAWSSSEQEAPDEESEAEPVAESVGNSGAAAAPARAKARPKGSLAAEPVDRDDAIERVAAAARFWRTEDPYSPAPYLMLRGMRWGELRASDTLDPSTFEAPDSETRTSLKRLLMEGSYAEAIEIAETAMASPAGRAWLDLQRYVVTAAEGLGYTAIGEAIKAELAALLKTFPDLKTWSLMDDTPCANNETVEWLNTFADSSSTPAPVPMWEPRYEETESESSSGEEGEKTPDAFELAMEAARSGRQQEAFEILIREAAHQNSGRGRFQRRLQLAQVCLSTGAETIAFPILQELASTISKHQLEDWESPDMVAHAFALLYRCMSNASATEEEKKTLYSKICRLDPLQALAHSR